MPIYILITVTCDNYKGGRLQVTAQSCLARLLGCSFFVEGRHLSIQNKKSN
jgi:hypothetical protein